MIGFAIGVNSVHDGSLTLATVSASRGPAVTDKCTDNPADPSCPPMGPNDAKCAGAWRYTAACVGGPFDPNNISNCTPITPAVRGLCLTRHRRLPRRSSLRRQTKDTNLPLRRITTSLGRHPGPTTPAQGNRRLEPITRDRANHHPLRIIRNPARLMRRRTRRKRGRHRLRPHRRWRPRPSHPMDRRKPSRLHTHPMSRRPQFRLPSHRRRSWRRLRSLPLHRLHRHRRSRRSPMRLTTASRQDVRRELVEVRGKGARGENSHRSRTGR
jgi:hypothetical protein